MRQKSGRMLLGFLLALTIVIGLFPGMSLTAYAESTDIGVGTTWYVGDSINLGGNYFVKYNNPDTGEPYVYQSKDEGNEVPEPDLIYGGKQWRFRECVKTTSFSVIANISVVLPDDKDVSEKPIGFRIKSGDGTDKDPYTFELVYSPKINVSLDMTTLSMIVDPNSSSEILTATVSSDEAIDKTVEWSNSDDTVVQARPNSNLGDDGYQNLCYVRALKAGTSTITVTATNGTENTSDDKTATCTVKVYDPYPVGTVWHLGDTINLHGAWYLAQNDDQYEQHSKDEDSVVPTNPQLSDAAAVFSEFIPVSEEGPIAGGEILPYTDGSRGSLRINIPADKKGKTPTGIKLVKGKGTGLHPYEFELVYEDAPKAAVFQVRFVDGQGKTLKTEKVESGKAATAPSAPKRTGYTFTGWDKDFSKVTGDMTVTARWKKNAETAPAAGVSGKLFAKMTAKGKSSLVLTWNKINGAEGYDIFLGKCAQDNPPKLVMTIKGNKTFKWTKKNLKKKKSYKAVVRAYVMKNGKKSYVRTSPAVHAYTSGGTKRYTNAKSVTVKKASVSLKTGKTYKSKVRVAKLQKGKKLMPSAHTARVRYLSTNTKVAAVSSSGKITAKAKGTCKVYVYAHNGIRKAITVTVK